MQGIITVDQTRLAKIKANIVTDGGGDGWAPMDLVFGRWVRKPLDQSFREFGATAAYGLFYDSVSQCGVQDGKPQVHVAQDGFDFITIDRKPYLNTAATATIFEAVAHRGHHWIIRQYGGDDQLTAWVACAQALLEVKNHAGTMDKFKDSRLYEMHRGLFTLAEQGRCDVSIDSGRDINRTHDYGTDKEGTPVQVTLTNGMSVTVIPAAVDLRTRTGNLLSADRAIYAAGKVSEGAFFDEADQLYASLRTGEYKGEWFVPTQEILKAMHQQLWHGRQWGEAYPGEQVVYGSNSIFSDRKGRDASGTYLHVMDVWNGQTSVSGLNRTAHGANYRLCRIALG